MTTLTNIDHLALVQHRTHIATLLRLTGKALQTVQTCHRSGIRKQRFQVAGCILHKGGIYLHLEREDAILRSENLLFVLLKLGGYVTLGGGEGLLANPRLGHLVLVCVAYLDIVAEDVVVTDLERRYARSLRLTLQDLLQHLLAVCSHTTQVIQLGRHTIGYHTTLLYLIICRIGIDGLLQHIA